MKLCSLIKNLSCRVFGNISVEISGLYHKDTEVKENGLFFCLRGTKVDGNKFVESAIKNGAVAIVCQQEIPRISGITQIIVKNSREAMSQIACRFYSNPADKLKIIGVTGTNGKTTITNMLASIIGSAGKKAAIIGTNGVFFGGKKYETNMTTPDPIEFQKYLSMMLKAHTQYVCVEISAHAIDLCKIDGIKFESVIFTNLTEDHLDYFKTMERYFLTKAKLFSRKYAKLAAINIDDDYGKRLAGSINIPFVTYSKNEPADFEAVKKEEINARQKLVINDDLEIWLPLMGDFNISNALAAISTLSLLGFSKNEIKNGLENMKQVDGRFNSYLIAGKIIIIDYAHTPDGLKNILTAAKNIAGGHKLVSVFGCGGNRDAQKRPIMGSVASSLCDYIFITNDNPRFERAEDIAAGVASGIKSENFEICLDRSKAINKAFKFCEEGDVLVVAGKGAENYIEENGKKIPYSDFEEIEKIRRNL